MTSKKEVVPRLIHIFWDTKDIPLFLQQCIVIMKKNNPNWNIILYSLDDIKKWKEFPKFAKKKYVLERQIEDHKRAVSDWFRLQVLYTHGGVYIDMGSICLQNFDTLIDMTYPYIQCNGSFIKNFDAIESSFLAVAKGDKFIKLWLKENLISRNGTMHGSELEYSSKNIKFAPELNRYLPYLVPILSWCKVATENPNLEYRVIRPMMAPGGPYFWTSQTKSKGKYTYDLMSAKKSYFDGVCFIKLNGNQRILVQNIIDKNSIKHSFLIDDLNDATLQLKSKKLSSFVSKPSSVLKASSKSK